MFRRQSSAFSVIGINEAPQARRAGSAESAPGEAWERSKGEPSAEERWKLRACVDDEGLQCLPEPNLARIDRAVNGCTMCALASTFPSGAGAEP